MAILANSAETNRIITNAFKVVKDELKVELPKLKARNQTTEELSRFLGSWLTMRLRNQLVQAEHPGWGMTFTYRVDIQRRMLELNVREDSELAGILKTMPDAQKTHTSDLTAMLVMK